VLALASKTLAPSDSATHKAMARREVESGLTFVGFALFSCPLKRESAATLRALVKAVRRPGVTRRAWCLPLARIQGCWEAFYGTGRGSASAGFGIAI
jgi:hypothetical protein